MYRIGLDVGSTTAKIVVIDNNAKLLHTDYLRHNTQVYETVSLLLAKASYVVGNEKVALTITGSAGMGISEYKEIPFVQELIAATEVIQQLYPQVKTLIDIGGEDSKMIFFSEERIPDIRMNGSCAGGTGAFIDQMATMINIDIKEINKLAEQYTNIYPIASRCGVFAKTDIQNLISRKIPIHDIAASVFHAVAIQSLNTLARGYEVLSKVMFIGGPFTFLPELTKCFVRLLNINIEDIQSVEHSEIIPAFGAALLCKNEKLKNIHQFQEKLSKNTIYKKKNLIYHRLQPLFSSEKEWINWQNENMPVTVKRTSIKDYSGTHCFLGIDSGSTTTKIVALGDNNEIIFDFYSNNLGHPVEATQKGLNLLQKELQKNRKSIKINRSIVTGYGEELIKAAFNIDEGVVETIAHFVSARHIDPDVTFILDIGGQDMKAIFVCDGIIQRIELNESCSSGCGSFIENFAQNLGLSVMEFSLKACQSKYPCDLGTRCTVFMNSKVKQSLRENATIDDIAAGLSYSVIKNALIKVLNVTNYDELGSHLSVQGGAFRNQSIRRALEILSKKPVVMTDIPELMGAYGAAIIAHRHCIMNFK